MGNIRLLHYLRQEDGENVGIWLDHVRRNYHTANISDSLGDLIEKFQEDCPGDAAGWPKAWLRYLQDCNFLEWKVEPTKDSYGVLPQIEHEGRKADALRRKPIVWPKGKLPSQQEARKAQEDILKGSTRRGEGKKAR